MERTITSFKGLGYEYSLSGLSFGANWLVTTKCMERQSNNHKINMHVESCSKIIIHLRETPNGNFYTTSLTTHQHNEMMSTFSSDTLRFLSMTENESGDKLEKKHKGECNLGQ